ncbi:FliO/MopB family protein [Acidocella sp.]|jgi:flagellar biogenesis protein FliO|uniref:FliO/MopB family protein n=1 Tax=Acidocella sp. TaxID=50710 RepID=UPI002F408FE8
MSSVFGASTIISTLVPLVVILGLLMAAAYVARRWRDGNLGARRTGQNAITIVATRPVGPGAALMIVEAEGQRFLVSSGRQGLTPIGALGGTTPPAFSSLLDTAQSPAPDA